MNGPCESSPYINVSIADESRMGSELLAEAVRHDRHLLVIGSTASSTEFLRLSVNRVDVAVISATLDGYPTKGFQVARELLATSPGTQVVMLLDSSKPEQVVGAFRVGTRGVLSRNQSLQFLCKCIRCVHKGQVWATNCDLTFVLQALAGAPQFGFPITSEFDVLSRRERDVVRCVAGGLSNRQIAQRLELSEHTVRNYLCRSFEKLGVSSRIELLLRASAQPSARESSSDNRWVIARDASPSFELLRKSAGEGVPEHQFALGQMYRDGNRCSKDIVNAFMWFSVAENANSDLLKRCQTARREVAADMTNIQIAEAERRAAEWLRQRSERPEQCGVPKSSGVRVLRSGKQRAQLFQRPNNPSCESSTVKASAKDLVQGQLASSKKKTMISQTLSSSQTVQ